MCSYPLNIGWVSGWTRRSGWSTWRPTLLRTRRGMRIHMRSGGVHPAAAAVHPALWPYAAVRPVAHLAEEALPAEAAGRNYAYWAREDAAADAAVAPPKSEEEDTMSTFPKFPIFTDFQSLQNDADQGKTEKTGVPIEIRQLSPLRSHNNAKFFGW